MTGTITPLLLRVDDIAEALAVSRRTVYELLDRGDLESVHIGTARRIPADALTAYVDRLREQAG